MRAFLPENRLICIDCVDVDADRDDVEPWDVNTSPAAAPEEGFLDNELVMDGPCAPSASGEAADECDPDVLVLTSLEDTR